MLQAMALDSKENQPEVPYDASPTKRRGHRKCGNGPLCNRDDVKLKCNVEEAYMRR